MHLLRPIAVLLLSLACASSTSPDAGEQVILEPRQLRVPESVTRGESFEAQLTVETGDCLRFSHVETSAESGAVALVAWGHRTSGAVCHMLLSLEPTSVPMRAPDSPGTMTLIARGQDGEPIERVVVIE